MSVREYDREEHPAGFFGVVVTTRSHDGLKQKRTYFSFLERSGRGFKEVNDQRKEELRKEARKIERNYQRSIPRFGRGGEYWNVSTSITMGVVGVLFTLNKVTKDLEDGGEVSYISPAFIVNSPKNKKVERRAETKTFGLGSHGLERSKILLLRYLKEHKVLKQKEIKLVEKSLFSKKDFVDILEQQYQKSPFRITRRILKGWRLKEDDLPELLRKEVQSNDSVSSIDFEM